MSDISVNIDILIDSVRAASPPDVATGAIALLNLVPYAGGAVAAILGDFASNRRAEKICDVLANLNTALERHKLAADHYLDRDQVVELVYETLQAASVSSDKRKVEALKAGLVSAFVRPGSFDRKQLFLQILREMSGAEISVLRVLYKAADPFISGQGGPPRTAENASQGHQNLAKGFWEVMGRSDNKGGQTLLRYLASLSQLDTALVEGALRRLDGRGLSSATANFERSDLQIARWIPMPAEHIDKLNVASFVYKAGQVPLSPLSASRTAWGAEFLKMWSG